MKCQVVSGERCYSVHSNINLQSQNINHFQIHPNENVANFIVYEEFHMESYIYVLLEIPKIEQYI